MHERFPSLDAADVIQETLIELIKAFPVYHYSPKEKGHCCNAVVLAALNSCVRFPHLVRSME